MPTALRISDAASLGIHAGALLAATPEPRLTASQIASQLGASEAHLAKVLQRMKRAGLLTSGRGPRGGFALALPAERINLLQIYRAVEGNMTLSNCLLPQPVCNGSTCILGSLMRTVSQELLDHLSSTTLADVAGVFGKLPAADREREPQKHH